MLWQVFAEPGEMQSWKEVGFYIVLYCIFCILKKYSLERLSSWTLAKVSARPQILALGGGPPGLVILRFLFTLWEHLSLLQTFWIPGHANDFIPNSGNTECSHGCTSSQPRRRHSSFHFSWRIVYHLTQGCWDKLSPKILFIIWILSVHFYPVSSLGNIQLKFLLSYCYTKKWLLLFSSLLFLCFFQTAPPSSTSYCDNSTMSSHPGSHTEEPSLIFTSLRTSDIKSEEPNVSSLLPSLHRAGCHHLRHHLTDGKLFLIYSPHCTKHFSLESLCEPYTFSDALRCACLRWNDTVFSGRNLVGATDCDSGAFNWQQW
jgi:hypothetical protein